MKSHKPIIAVVDDDEAIRKSLKRLLVVMGFDVETFASGTEFLASLKTQSPDSVLLDMHMPDLNGPEVQACLAATSPWIPVLCITAHYDPAMRAKALADGAAAYFDKPVCEEVLMDGLFKALSCGRSNTPPA